MNSDMIKYLPWDSSHFGFRIARARTRRLELRSYRQLDAACRDQDIACLYFLARSEDQATVSTLQDHGFEFVDIRLTLAGLVSEIPRIPASGSLSFRPGREGDLEALLPVARDSYFQSRFFVDQRFGRAKAARMYQIWLEKSFTSDFADAVTVAELAGQPVGFVTCHLGSPKGEANIALVGVAEPARGLGCARGMLGHMAMRLSERRIERLNVVTQGRNVAAQRLYQRCGMVTRSVDLWFHKWFQQTS